MFTERHGSPVDWATRNVSCPQEPKPLSTEPSPCSPTILRPMAHFADSGDYPSPREGRWQALRPSILGQLGAVWVILHGFDSRTNSRIADAVTLIVYWAMCSSTSLGFVPAPCAVLSLFRITAVCIKGSFRNVGRFVRPQTTSNICLLVFFLGQPLCSLMTFMTLSRALPHFVTQSQTRLCGNPQVRSSTLCSLQ